MSDGVILRTADILQALGTRLPEAVDHAVVEACTLHAPHVEADTLLNYVQSQCGASNTEQLIGFLRDVESKYGNANALERQNSEARREH